MRSPAAQRTRAAGTCARSSRSQQEGSNPVLLGLSSCRRGCRRCSSPQAGPRVSSPATPHRPPSASKQRFRARARARVPQRGTLRSQARGAHGYHYLPSNNGHSDPTDTDNKRTQPHTQLAERANAHTSRQPRSRQTSLLPPPPPTHPAPQPPHPPLYSPHHASRPPPTTAARHDSLRLSATRQPARCCRPGRSVPPAGSIERQQQQQHAPTTPRVLGAHQPILNKQAKTHLLPAPRVSSGRSARARAALTASAVFSYNGPSPICLSAR